MKKPTKPAVESISEPMRDLAALPAPVRALREKILAACETGDIEALRIPIDWNEVRPLFERGARRPAGADPIEVLKSLSFDRAGREMLVLARAVLTQPFLRVARGPFEAYEWPAYARRPTPPANEEEARALWACVRFFDLVSSNADGRPKVMRIGVGADGVWHYFWNAD
ncbi:hypothetical protein [Methylosinus sp. Ce-a6]|uniref:hypothetical protein n=1 Tax=Methylosinus sp. Ce-a6 TaxID=2172005 RepID=UPI001FCEA4D5|nr:hypothetical protein [Methylosinus sp. Ce-a6]